MLLEGMSSPPCTEEGVETQGGGAQATRGGGRNENHACCAPQAGEISYFRALRCARLGAVWGRGSRGGCAPWDLLEFHF